MALDFDMLLRVSSRESGTATIPTFGSIVQNGKLAACAFPFSQIALKRVLYITGQRP